MIDQSNAGKNKMAAHIKPYYIRNINWQNAILPRCYCQSNANMPGSITYRLSIMEDKVCKQLLFRVRTRKKKKTKTKKNNKKKKQKKKQQQQQKNKNRTTKITTTTTTKNNKQQQQQTSGCRRLPPNIWLVKSPWLNFDRIFWDLWNRYETHYSYLGTS